MKEKNSEKLKAIELRKQGYSLNEIYRELGVSKSSISFWVRDLNLTPRIRKILLEKRLSGAMRGGLARRKGRLLRDLKVLELAQNIVQEDTKNSWNKIRCALIYWCEGAKDNTSIQFMNSDPALCRFFIDSLVKHFGADKSRFHILLHLHDYHKPEIQRRFWSYTLGIEKKQFYKPYLKQNSGRRVRLEYPGCASVRYYDSMLARQLLYIAREVLKKGV